MAKKTVAAKKRNVKVDANGQLHVHSSFNNIIVSLAKRPRSCSHLRLQRYVFILNLQIFVKFFFEKSAFSFSDEGKFLSFLSVLPK